MHRSFITLLAFVVVPLVVLADDQQHSVCYNYFLQKDKCVFGSVDKPCCETHHPTKHICPSGGTFQHPDTDSDRYTASAASKLPGSRKVRRYDTTLNSSFVAGGTGNCQFYNTTSDMGVCLWSGPQSNVSAASAGWLNSQLTQNCRKQVWIQRQGQPATVKYVPILDSCGFNTDAPEIGCFQVFVTKALFDAFNATDEENAAGALMNLSWDFDNPPNANKPQNAPI